MAEREPTRFSARTRISHDYRPVEKDLFGFRLADVVMRPILRRVCVVPLESFDVLEELRQERHESVYAYRIHLLKVQSERRRER